MILVDANVFMYAAGRPHPHKEPSLRWLERVATGHIEAAVDAESLQEILHRYRAIGRWADGRQVYDLARVLVPDVIDIGASAVDGARELMDRYPELLARDALHAAVALELHAEAICSWDSDFDAVSGLRRMEPGHGS